MTAVSNTVEYQRAKCKKFYYSRKARDPVGHKAKQDRNSKAWRKRHPDRVRKTSALKYAANPSYYNRASRKSLEKAKRRVVEAYGGCCALCFESRMKVLTVDHVGGWGKAQRALTARSVLTIVIEEGFPSTYRILCRNCNMRDQFTRRRDQGLVEGRAAKERQRRNLLKLETFNHYGGIHCSCCGGYDGDPDVLTLDHTEPCRLGRNRPYSGWRLYEHLRALGYPDGYTVMCFNCNWMKGQSISS